MNVVEKNRGRDIPYRVGSIPTVYGWVMTLVNTFAFVELP